jgi:diguanylate cyclase (GGDEF)-like protein/PAS domain S-box-containing protein
MPKSSPSPIEIHDSATRMHQARLVMLFRASKAEFLITPIGAALVISYFWSKLPTGLMVLWCAAMFAVTSARWCLFVRFTRRPRMLHPAQWEWRFASFRGLLAACWVSFIIGALQVVDATDQLFLAILFMGIVVLGMAAVAASPRAFQALLLPAWIFGPPAYFWMGGALNLTLGSLCFVTLLVVTAIQRRMYATVLQMVRSAVENRALARRLRNTEQALSDAFQNVPVGLALYDSADRLIRCNDLYLDFLSDFRRPENAYGMTYRELVERALSRGDLVPPKQPTSLEAWVDERVKNHREGDGSVRILCLPNHRWRQSQSHRTHQGSVVCAHVDITRIKHMEEALKDALQEQELIFQTVDVGILIVRGRHVAHCNSRLAEMFSATVKALVGREPCDFYAESEDWARVSRQILPVMRELGRYETDLLLRRADRTTFWAHVNGRPVDPDDLTKGSVWGLTDITSRRTREAAIAQLAYYDPLTGLTNRRLMEDRLNQAIRAAERNKAYLALIVLDCDDFKRVNDTHGHGTGDRVLITVAERLRQSTRDSDTVSRLGGDEFVLLLPDVAGAEAIEIVADKILHAMQNPMLIDTLALIMGVSMGIALFPRDGGTALMLMHSADSALYRAKEAGRNTYRFHARTNG